MASQGATASRSPGGWLLASLVLIVGLALAGLSLPRLVAALALLPGDVVEEAYRDHVAGARPPLTGAELDLWHDSRRAALRVVDSPAAWGNLAFIELIAASRATGIERHERRMLAREHLWRALGLGPTNGFAWYRLAITESALGAPVDRVLEAVAASIAVAPYQPTLLEPRVRLVMRHWDVASDELRQLAIAQASNLRIARHAGGFERLAREFPQRAEELRQAAGNHRNSLRAIERGLAPPG